MMLSFFSNLRFTRSWTRSCRLQSAGCVAALMSSVLLAAQCGCYRWQKQIDPFSYLENPSYSPIDHGPHYAGPADCARTGLQQCSGAIVVRVPRRMPPNPSQFTIEQALLYTLDNHPRLRARAEEVEVARADLIAAGLLPNPQLVVDTDAPINESGPVELSGRLVFTIPTGGKRGRAAAAARAGITKAQAAIGVEANALLTETADAVLEVLYLQELVQLERELATMAEDAAKLELARIGTVAPASQGLASEINAAEIEFDALNNESLLDVARLRLSRAMGIVRPQEIQVAGSLDVHPFARPPLDTLLSEVLTVRPELAEAEAAIEKSRRDAVAAQAKAVPDIDLGPRYQSDLGEQRDKLGVRFGMDLPWFDRKQGDIYEASWQARVNEALRDDLRIQSLHDVAKAYQQLEPIETALAQYNQRILPLMRRTEALLRDPDLVRALDMVQLSDQLRKLDQVRLKELKLRYEHNRIRTTLELLLGRRLTPDGIGEPETLPPGQMQPMPPAQPGPVQQVDPNCASAAGSPAEHRDLHSCATTRVEAQQASAIAALPLSTSSYEAPAADVPTRQTTIKSYEPFPRSN